MPIIKSAMKRVRQQEKRRARNTATKRRIKASTKTTLAHIDAKDAKSAHGELLKAIAMLDKAVKKGTLHKNTAARRKSKLTMSYNKVAKEAFGTTPPTTKKTAPAKKGAASKKPTTSSKPAKKAPTKPKTTTKTAKK